MANAPAPSDPKSGYAFYGDLGKLVSFSFRGIEFPTSDFKLALRHDLAVHRYPNRDGAQVEATGRAPLEIRASIPFLNGLGAQGRSANEKWLMPLYPTEYRRFLNACSDRTTGDLTHPELGKMRVKTVSMDTDWTATTRDGVHVDVTWLETIEDDTDRAGIGAQSPIAQLQSSATAIDQWFQQPVAPYLPKPKFSLGDLARALKSIPDQVALTTASIIGPINQLAYWSNALITAMTSNPSALNWPLMLAAQNLKAAALDAKLLLHVTGKDIGLYVVKVDSTFAAIANELNKSMSDVMVLNPGLLQKPVVPRGTTVRYYL